MVPPKNSFCFAPKYNSPQHGHPLGTDGKELMRHDATGAFHPYMEAYRKLYARDGGQVTTLKFDNNATPAAKLRDIVRGFASAPPQIDAVVYFGHGIPSGMASAHIYRDSIAGFAKLIRENCVQDVRILLYACSCARLSYKGGCFAGLLATELSDMGAVVYGHNDPGHTTTNPHLYRYKGISPGTQVAPPGMTKAFNTLLKTECLDKKPKGNSAFWARIPFMTDAEIVSELGG